MFFLNFVHEPFFYFLQNQIHVNLQLEISPHHQDIVKGKNNSQLLSIMERTKTKVQPTTSTTKPNSPVS